MGLTINIISPFLTSNIQLSLSPALRLNCLTMLIGTVVLKDMLFVFASVKDVVMPPPILSPSRR